MRKSIVKYTALLFLTFVGIGHLYAQTALQSDWDQVLDRYGQICDQCISLKNNIQNGGQVPADKVSSLFQELAMLRNSLQKASGVMTTSQEEKFSAIRNRYQKQFESSSDNNATVRESVQRPVTTKNNEQLQPTFTSVATAEPIQPLTVSALSDVFPDTLPIYEIIIEDNRIGTHRQIDDAVVSDDVSTLRKWRIHVMGTIDFGRINQYGMALAVGKRNIGLFIGAQSNFMKVSADYACLMDGSIPGGGFFWGDGCKNDYSSRFLAGLYWSPSDYLLIYANSGVCSDNIYWRDSNGQWACVSDISGRGALFGVGAVVPVKHLSLTSGIQYDCFERVVTANAGLGFNFRL